MSARFALRPGRPFPLGASVKTNGTNFAVFSDTATKIELCLFDDSGHSEVARIPLYKDEQDIWHIFIKGVGEGQLYAYRSYGQYEPENGYFHNPNKLLIDPYAKGLFGEFNWGQAHVSDLSYCRLDSMADMPKCRVVNLPSYSQKRPKIPWHKTIIYECHVKGATAQFPGLTNKQRGTFAGISSPEFIAHLKALGVTSLELLPVHSFVSERFLAEKSLTNYWGYNPLNFFTPHLSYCENAQPSDFQNMVMTLHQAGIEVILDVVYNHTAEADDKGPILSYRGLANSTYYRLSNDNKSCYINDTGCGNTINFSSSATIRLVLDSLRYWVEVMGVDGFRFDLATILGRDYDGFKQRHAFFQALAQDPVLCKVKLIAEPWDIGPGGYQLGNFSAPWREWNDRYRDVMRRFWRGDDHQLPEFAKYFHGSSHIFEKQGRAVTASINFVTAHDGFTLNDVVSYKDKHNLLNGEDNRDGHNENYSANWGAEGKTKDPQINALRLQQQKNMLVSLLLASGVPMLVAGTEVGHSQHGNNNAYCQDNLLTWIDWGDQQNDIANHELFLFIRKLIDLRNRFSLYRQSHFIHASDERFTLTWLTANAVPMTQHDWQSADVKALGYLMVDKQDQHTMLLIFNASNEATQFALPTLGKTQSWQVCLNTCTHSDQEVTNLIDLPAHSAWVLAAQSEKEKLSE